MEKITLLIYRGQSVNNVIQSQLWWNGPAASLSAKPTDTTEEDSTAEEANTELRTKFAVAVQFTSTDPAEPLLDLDKYSGLRTVLRLTAWMRRFMNNARSSQKTHGELTVEELTAAEMYWVKVTQEQGFSHELSLLKSGRELDKFSKIKDLKPFLDENGLISVGGRLQQSVQFQGTAPLGAPPKTQIY